jgi:excisionase family DNA binding protein
VVAFVPISPAAARQLLDGIGEVDSGVLLGDFVEHGLIKAYARVVETLSTGGGRQEVRDARIPTTIWKRIVAEDKLPDVWATSSVRLEGDGLVGGRPALNVIGIRFEERAIKDAAIKHAADPVPASSRSPKVKATRQKAPVAADEPVEVASAPVAGTDAPPLIIRAPSDAVEVDRGLAADVLSVSVPRAMAIIDVSRTTIYKLLDEGKLNMTKVGGRTLVDADSIRGVLGKS